MEDGLEQNNNKKRKLKIAKPGRKTKKAKQIQEDGGLVGIPQQNETSYLIEKEYRYVVPYYYKFEVCAKERWIKKEIYKVYLQEFIGKSEEYYKKKIEKGEITINSLPVELNTTIKSRDLLSHSMHRHEPPVLSLDIQIIDENEELLIINKPPSIPVHPCGRYRHNSITFILAKEKGYSNLHCIHRLDRLTSGLLMFAKSKELATKYSEKFQERKLQKTYIAKVNGKFPNEEIEVDQPILVQPEKKGINRVDPNGKPSKTYFKLKNYNEKTNTSLIKCKPVTGRTHQIRVHLQYLGYPITNDPVFNEEHKKKLETKVKTYLDHNIFSEYENNFDEICQECNKEIEIDQPDVDEMYLYLHALKYQGEDFKFKANPPQCWNQIL